MQCKWFEVCPMKFYYERGLLEKHWIEDYCFNNYLSCIRYKMEESGKYHEDWMLPDGTIDENLKNSSA
ncbi:uracil-DNA glycosylase [candidate division KSB1 bacterium]|nr:MAG: uracil-DNA glycosylase [candidate division KSB1 bacterium]